jgi:KaiC/GvpD/RAD55 family RecA-like ATPase
MTTQFTRAKRVQRKFKGALIGVSGSGKTWTMLELLTGLAGEGGKIAVIDSEAESSSLYADEFTFDSMSLTDISVRSYIDAIEAAAKAGYTALGIDSLSHAWDWLLEEADHVTQRSNSKNSFQAWAQVTPIYKELVAAIVRADIHIICTMRAKSDYVMEEKTNKAGKTTMSPKKVGLAPIFRAGGEYEFDVVGLMDLEHRLVIEKSRMKFLADRVVLKPTRKIGAEIKDWLASAAVAEPKTPVAPASTPVTTDTPKQRITRDAIASKMSFEYDAQALADAIPDPNERKAVWVAAVLTGGAIKEGNIIHTSAVIAGWEPYLKVDPRNEGGDAPAWL